MNSLFQRIFLVLLLVISSGALASPMALQLQTNSPLRIGVYHGTFDPFHNAHEAIVNEVLDKNLVDVVAVIPNDQLDYKPNALPLDVRHGFVTNHLSLNSRVYIPGIVEGEALLETFLKDIDALPRAAELLGIIGSDNVNGSWGYVIDNLIDSRVSTWVVNTRGQDESNIPASIKGKPTFVISATGDEISSTLIRDQLKTEGRSHHLHPLNNSFIHQNGFYTEQSRHIKVVTDTEGRKDALIAAATGNGLIFENNQLDFTDEKTELLFLGDATDRGSDSIKIVDWLVDLKERYPERVTLLWGNRDLNKLQLLNTLPMLQNLSDPEYVSWLSGKFSNELPSGARDNKELLQHFNGLENQLNYWLQNQGASGALAYHREELSRILGREISEREAAENYIERLKPGGKFFRYLELGQLGFVKDDKIAVHGGLTKNNVGVVPGAATRENSVTDWIQKLNQWGSDELQKFKRALVSRSGPGLIRSHLIVYGDATWDPVLKMVMATDQSVVYPFRSRQDGNFRLYDPEVLQYLSRNGNAIRIAINGHSPVGNASLPLSTANGFLQIMADTSFGPNGGQSTLDIYNSLVVGVGTLSNGDRVSYRLDPSTNGPIGLLQDEKVIVGQNQNGEFIAYSYYDGFKINEEVVTPTNVQPPTYKENEEIAKSRALLYQELDRQNVRVLNSQEIRHSHYTGRVPIFFSGASRYSVDERSASIIRMTIQQTLINLDPKKVFIVTGGSDLGVEKVVHELAGEMGFDILGAISEITNPTDIKSVDRVVITGETWDDFMTPALEYVKELDGHAVFIGGGGVVTAGIEDAKKLGLKMHLMSTVKGASQNLSTPENSFTDSKELLERMATASTESFVKAMPRPLWLASQVETEFAKIRAQGKKVLIFIGYSGAGYEDNAAMMKQAREVLETLDPKEWVVNIGATKEGIGGVYEIARQLGFFTMGIVSAKVLQYDLKESLSPFLDRVFIVRDTSWGGILGNSLSPTSSAMVNVSDKVVALGGGDVSKAEFLSARAKGISTQYFAFDMNHQIAIEKALRNGAGTPTREYLRGPLRELRETIRGGQCSSLFGSPL